LLDKRFYIPTVKNLKFFSLSGNDFSMLADSAFYKKLIVNRRQSKFFRNNLFFLDSLRYDNNSTSFLSYQISPTMHSVDFFSLKVKPRVYTCKPFFMSFKNFSENQFEGFERFYLKNKLFLADSFEYSIKNDENFDFYLKKDNTTIEERYQEFRHFYRVRTPFEGEDNEIGRGLIDERAEEAKTEDFDTDKGFREMFEPKGEFFRDSSNEKYKGYGSFKYKGRFLDTDVIYNFFNYKAYDWKNFFLFNFVFGLFRDQASWIKDQRAVLFPYPGLENFFFYKKFKFLKYFSFDFFNDYYFFRKFSFFNILKSFIYFIFFFFFKFFYFFFSSFSYFFYFFINFRFFFFSNLLSSLFFSFFRFFCFFLFLPFFIFNKFNFSFYLFFYNFFLWIIFFFKEIFCFFFRFLKFILFFIFF
jgi:hypothetical protein